MQASQAKKRTKETGSLRSSFVRWPGAAEGGQQALEYALIVAVISAALLAMYVYTKRGLQASIKVAADQLGSQLDSEQTVDPLVTTNSIGTSASLSNGTNYKSQTGNARFVDTSDFSRTTGMTTVITDTY